MSRTTRNDRWTHTKVRDGQQQYQCRCNWCININYRDRYGLTVKENLKANGEIL
jgi:hypothetical protein